jgi:hypothetical protein
MNDVAFELRDLAQKISKLVHESSVASLAWEPASTLCDYLMLRARVIDLQDKHDKDGK